MARPTPQETDPVLSLPPLPALVRHTSRLTLRALDIDDASEFVRMVEESATAWAPWTPRAKPGTTADSLFRKEIERTRRGREAGTHLRLGGFDADGRLVGLFALNEIVRGVLESAHASWQIRGGHEGRGLATEGVVALLDIAFAPSPEGVGLHRVQANIMPGNAASLRVAEKVGFRREGLALRYLKIAGQWADHAMFALTREEWRDRSPAEGGRSR